MNKSESPGVTWWKSPSFWVFLIAFLLRFQFLQHLADSIFFEPIPNGNDRALYDRLARQIATGNVMPHGVFEYMPLYPWILGLLYVVAPANLWFAGFLGVLLDSLTASLIAGWVRGFGVRSWGAWVAGLAYAVYPVAIVYSALTMPNTLNTFLLLIFAIGVFRLKNEGSPWKWWRVGLVAGVLSLGFAGALLVWAACLVYWILDAWRTGRWKGAQWICFVLGALLPVLPVTLHNWRAEQHFVLITAHGGFNFYMGNHEHATGYPVQIAGFRGDAGSLLVDARNEAEKELGRKVTSAEFAGFWSKRARDFMIAHPFLELQLLGVKVLKFWNHYDYDDLRMVPMARLTGLMGWIPPLNFACIGCLGLVGLFFARGVGVLRWMALAAMAGMIAFFITARYRMTVAPLLCALGVVGVESLLRGSVTGRWKIGVAVFLSGLVMWPMNKSDFRALDRYNTAAYFLARERPAEAWEQSRAGLLLGADPSLYFVSGNALYLLHRDAEAEEAFRQSLALRPNDASTHFNLSRVLERLGRVDEARAERKRALELDPQHSE